MCGEASDTVPKDTCVHQLSYKQTPFCGVCGYFIIGKSTRFFRNLTFKLEIPELL